MQNCPRYLQLAITLPGWIRSSVTSGHVPLDSDGCYVSRGKTTPTLHFLCLQGSHAINAVSTPSSLMLSNNGRVVAMHLVLQSLNWSQRWTEEICPQ